MKMMPYDEFAAEQRGREEAWELIKAIGKMSYDDMVNCFGTSIIVNLSYAEAKAKYDAWKKQKDELKIGDEVIHDTHRRCVLLEKKNVCEAELWAVIDEKGVVHQINRKHIIRKTGRTFPEVAELLEKMRKPE